MYSRNDYRYYLENQLCYSDDFLAHYGVKGMKWKKKKGMIAVSKGINNGANETVNPGASHIARDISIGSAITKGVARKADVDAAIQMTNRRFYGSNGKKKKKNKLSAIRKKYGLYREKPKGTKIKGSKNIYVSHE